MNLSASRQVLVLERKYHSHIILASFQSHFRKGTLSLGNKKTGIISEKLFLSIDFNIL